MILTSERAVNYLQAVFFVEGNSAYDVLAGKRDQEGPFVNKHNSMDRLDA